jgi:ectoine hydroxylase-related dioxygenase (phytanoyl-CoA dioxygenase family)
MVVEPARAGLTSEQLRQYYEQGYVMLRRLFEPSELRPLIDEIDAAVDRQAREWYAEGRIGSAYAEHGFETRFIKMVEDAGETLYNQFTGSRLLVPALFDLLRHPKLLDIVEPIVGPEIHCEGRHRLRPKLPNYDLADFRWHEDTLYAARRITYVEQQFGLGPHDPKRNRKVISRIVAAPQMPEPGFWIPLVDVDELNGCLHLLPGGHMHTAPTIEEWEPGGFVAQIEGLEPVAAPMRVGDVLLMHQHFPHNSPPNRSDHIRWSVDIRYQGGHFPVKSAREPGFLARSKERPQDVVTTFEGYARIREAVQELQRSTGLRF